jgi:nucleoredoxin
MRYFSCLLLLVASVACAGTLPLTVSEISLMLRSGYTSATVEQEIAARHFADTLDESKSKKLIEAGASAQLIEALAGGKFAAPKEEMEKARRQREQQEQQRALAGNRETKQDAQNQGARQPAAAKPSADVIAAVLKGNLVRCHNGLLTSYYDEELNRKKIYGLYFSAHWCPPCRKFTPQLVDYYNKITRDHPEFEIIFLSADKTPEAMAGYMRDAGMPWPAVDYVRLGSVPDLMKYAGDGIPDLVVVDSSGKVLADSYVRGTYVGPAQVLGELDKLLANGAGSNVAAR